MGEPFSAAALAAIAARVAAGLPAQFRQHCADVVFAVEDFATQEHLSSVGLVDRWELSGLYEGLPLPDQSIWDHARMPPRVWLFRMPLLAEMRSRRLAIEDLVRHVVIHELGHHFGFSDDDMHALEQAAGGAT